MNPWIIYYDDETTFTSKEGDWTEAPSYGVLFVVVDRAKPGKTLVHMGQDYYLKRNDVIYTFNERNLHEQMILGMESNCMKIGRWCPNDVWERTHDKIFPPNK